MTTPQQPPNEAHMDLFSGIASEAQLDQFERTATSTGKMAAFGGSIDPNLQTTFINPNELVDVYLWPHRTFSQVLDPAALAGVPKDAFTLERLEGNAVAAHYLPGRRYRVARLTYEANRAVLASPGEYAKVMAQGRTARHQQVQREILSMRKHTSDTSERQWSPEQRARLDELRGAERAEEERIEKAEEQLRQTVKDRSAAEMQRDHAALDAKIANWSAGDLDAHLAEVRQQTQKLMERLGEKARKELGRIAAEEEADLRQRWQQAQHVNGALTRTVEPASDVPVADKVAKLKGLLSSGVISQDDYDRQLGRLLG